MREKSFLRRWSKRKIGKLDKLESDTVSGGIDSFSEGSDVEHSIAADRWVMEEGDHPAFPELPDLLELKNLFKRPEISMLDGLNEYDRDYTDYSDLSGILTNEMKRKLALSLADRIPGSGLPDGPKALDSKLSEIPEDPSISDESESKEDS